MFKTGDAIVHPVRGAGVVVCIEERQWHGSRARYYRIKLLGQPSTSLMVPVKIAETMGLRRAIPQSKLRQVWRVLRADPNTLPTEHSKRYQVVEERLHAGDIFQVAEAVRDMAWRKQRGGGLTTRGKQMYEEGVKLLAGEVAATQGVALADAEIEIRERLWRILSSATAV
ncbi:MAG: CarD family transcriptional regulator [Anaerolineae bacterium]